MTKDEKRRALEAARSAGHIPPPDAMLKMHGTFAISESVSGEILLFFYNVDGGPGMELPEPVAGYLFHGPANLDMLISALANARMAVYGPPTAEEAQQCADYVRACTVRRFRPPLGDGGETVQ